MTTVAEIEKELAELRSEVDVGLRTSVMTHVAWIPPEWEPQAREVMATLGERHPSRVILLFPEPDAPGDDVEGSPSVECFDVGGHQLVCAETIELHLRGAAARAPASIVLPLAISDLPVFLRWRGRPPFGDDVFRQLADVADRLVVDSGEWDDLPAAYAPLSELFSTHVAVSDIAWARGRPWRGRLATRWPGIAELDRLSVRGPLADALLLHGWLRSRLEREIELEHEDADEIGEIVVDDEPVQAPRWSRNAPADLLSDQLDVFQRDPVYEDAVRAAAASTT